MSFAQYNGKLKSQMFNNLVDDHDRLLKFKPIMCSVADKRMSLLESRSINYNRYNII